MFDENWSCRAEDHIYMQLLLCVEFDFDIRFCVAPQKPSTNCERHDFRTYCAQAQRSKSVPLPTDFKSGYTDLNTDIRTDIYGLKHGCTDLNTDFKNGYTDLNTDIRTDIYGLKHGYTDLNTDFQNGHTD